ncbi:MAG: FecR domain-containing protein [Tannerellaceae bacterium]|nr:FecR domain-containing protein [Tannerellaceae bacterium]
MNKEIQLITADKVIELAGKDVQIELGEDGQALLLGVETETSELKLDTHTTNKLIVPYGKRSKVKLADGSRIWLNSGTELEFPSTFDGKTRQITIRGEMYLEVNRDETKSFIVHVPGFDILVHGTKFNVSAYADNHIQTVVLTEGKIEVTSPDRSPVMLSPNEMLLLQPDKWRKDTVNAQQHISWIDGMLYLNKISVTDVLKKIRRYYNVEFVMDEHELQAKTCTGKLYLSDDIDDVMISLSAISATEYHHERGKIHVKLKNTTLMTKDNLKKKHTNRII